jgi:hypothetical protein
VKFQEQVNMIRNNLYGMNPVSLLLADISEDELAILFDMKMDLPASMQSLPLSPNIPPSQAI